MDSHQHLHFNFAFIDEVYKIDNSFVIDQETSGENERDTAYRLALEFICNLTDNMLLAGPYMALPTAETELHKSFNDFARDNGLFSCDIINLKSSQKNIQQLKADSNTSSTIFRLKSVQRVKRRRLPILFWR